MYICQTQALAATRHSIVTFLPRSDVKARSACTAAWADDGTLEGVEDPSKRFALGVLWHPEEGEDAALFRALVEEARAYRAVQGR